MKGKKDIIKYHQLQQEHQQHYIINIAELNIKQLQLLDELMLYYLKN